MFFQVYLVLKYIIAKLTIYLRYVIFTNFLLWLSELFKSSQFIFLSLFSFMVLFYMIIQISFLSIVRSTKRTLDYGCLWSFMKINFFDLSNSKASLEASTSDFSSCLTSFFMLCITLLWQLKKS